MNRWTAVVIVAAFIGGEIVSADPARPIRPAMRAQLEREIQELEGDAKRSTLNVQRVQVQVEEAEKAMQEASSRVEAAKAASGDAGEEAQKAQQGYDAARERYFTAMNQRSRALYELNIVKRGISDRQALLQRNPITTTRANSGR